VVYNYPVGDVV